MLSSRGIAALVAACVTVALTAACGSSSDSSTSSSASTSSSSASAAATTAASAASNNSPITVLTISDTTGPAKSFEAPTYVGIEAAAAYYNAHGGIMGHHIVVKHVSDNGDPTTAVTDLVNQLSSGPAPTLVQAGAESAEAAALIPVLAKHDVLAMASGDGQNQCKTNAAKACPNFWALSGATGVPDETAVNWFKQRGIKKVGILQESIDFTETETPQFEAAAKAAGISTVVAAFPATAVNLVPQAQELKAAGAQGVFTEALAAPVGFALNARAKLGWNVPMVFDPAGSTLDQTKLAPLNELKDQSFVDIYQNTDPSDPAPGIKHLQQYAKPFGGIGAVPLDVPGEGWDEIVDLNAAVHAAGGKTDVKSLDAAMLKIPPTDPDRIFDQGLGFTTDNHENVLYKPTNFVIVPSGPIVDGQIQSFK